MAMKNLIVILALALYFIVLSTGNVQAEATSDDAIKNAKNIIEKKKDDAQSPGNMLRTSESATVNSCDEEFTIVSMIQLIASPAKFNGKCVLLVGFVHFEFESNSIFLHEEDYAHGLSKNGLWLSINEDRYDKEIRELNNKYVLVKGTFNAENSQLDAFSGAIENITRLDAWVVKKGPIESR